MWFFPQKDWVKAVWICNVQLCKTCPLKYTSSWECGRDNWRLIEILLLAAWPIISMKKSWHFSLYWSEFMIIYIKESCILRTHMHLHMDGVLLEIIWIKIKEEWKQEFSLKGKVNELTSLSFTPWLNIMLPFYLCAWRVKPNSVFCQLHSWSFVLFLLQ